MSNILVKFGLWLARLGGWQEYRCNLTHVPEGAQYLNVPEEVLVSAQMFVGQVEKSFSTESGEFKRHEVLRALLNKHAGVSERICAQAIELAL